MQFISPAIPQKSDGSDSKRATLRSFAVRAGNEPLKGFIGKSLLSEVIGEEMAVADRIEFRLGGGAARLVQETTLGIDPEADEIEKFLEVIDMMAFGAIRLSGGLVEVVNIMSDIGEGGPVNGGSSEMLAELAKDPGVADAGTPDHEARRSGIFEHPEAFADGGDVAIRKNRNGEGFCGPLDVFVMNGAAVGLLDGSGVQAQEVDLMFLDEFQDCLEIAVVLKPDAHLDGKASLDCFAQASQDAVHHCGVTEEPAADIFFVNLGGGATHIEIDTGNGQLGGMNRADGALEVGETFADELGEYGATGVVPLD